MLVLVFQKCKPVLNSTLKLSISACLVLLSSFAIAQQPDADSQKIPAFEKSVLARSGVNPAANAPASINDDRAIANPQATFTARPFSEAPAFPDDPQPPAGMLIPQSPSQDTFTNPPGGASAATDISFNGLRGAGGGKARAESTIDQDRSGAQGTFATTNQSWQNPLDIQNESSRGGFQKPGGFSPVVPPTNLGVGSTERPFAPPIVSSFGDSQNPTRSAPSQNRSVMLPQANSNQPIDDVEAQATPWRREVPDANQNSQRYPSNRVARQDGPNAGAAFNADAVSNYNRGVNPNIATGQLPQIQRVQGDRVRSFNEPAMQNFKRDDAVTPSAFIQPLAPTPKKTDQAKQLISRYSIDGLDPSQIPGQPVTLLEMMSQPISTEQRRPMVHQFWDTYFDWASLVNSQQYEALLSGIPSPMNASEKAILETAREVAKNEVLASEIQLIKSQSKLKQFMPNRSADLLPPLPNDLPLIQKYNTNYESYKKYQLLPSSLVGIDKMLPKTLELIIDRASTVQLAQSTNQQIRNGLATGQSSISVVLEAAKLWRASEQSLLVAVTEYNHAIGDYALTVSRGYQPPAQVVRMLIGKPKTVTADPNSVVEQFRNARIDQSRNQTRPQNNTSGSASLRNFGQPTTQAPNASSQSTGNTELFRQNAGGTANPNGFNLNAKGGFQSPPSNGSMAPATPMGQGRQSGTQGQGTFNRGFQPQPGTGQPNGNRKAQPPVGRNF